MWRLSICLLFLVFLRTAAAAEPHHCIAKDGTDREDMQFHESVNAEVSEDPFDVRVTSGYRKVGLKRRFIYCLENLRSSSVHSQWDGPKPTKLLTSKLGRPPRDGRTGKVTVHRETTGQWDSAPRVLHLRLAEYENYKSFEIETFIEKAEAPVVEVIPVQGEPVFPISSGEEFAAALADLDGPLALSAGIVFDMPRDAENWPEFVEGGGAEKVESSRIMAEVVLRYDRETLEVTLEALFGFSNAFPAPDLEHFLSGVSLDLGGGFGRFGFAGVTAMKPPFEDELRGIRPGFDGFTQTAPIGSLADFAQDARALTRGNVPIVFLLNGEPVAEFGLEVIGAPSDL